MIRLGAFTALLFASLSALSAPELKGSPNELQAFLHPKANIVSISASAEEKAYSDQAIVSVVVTTEDKTLSGSIALNSAIRAKLWSVLQQSGIDASAIKNSKFSSSPEYGWFGKKPSSFKVINRMAITISEEDHLKVIAKTTDQYSEAEISNTEFEHSQKNLYNEKVKKEALEKILKQKKFYEESLGLSLTAVGIRDNNIRQRATQGASILEEVIVTARQSNNKLSSSPGYQSHFPVSSFDEVLYEVSLTVDFKIDK